MKVADFTLILVGVLLNAGAQLCLKAGARVIESFKLSLDNIVPMSTALMANGAIWAGLFCYAVSVGVWILALARVEVSVAYPMLSIAYIVNAFFAYWLFGEVISVQRIVGMGLIIVGVIFIARS